MKKKNIYTFLLLLIVMLAVSMTLFAPIKSNTKLIIRILLLAVFFISWRIFDKKNLSNARDIVFALMALNLAFLVVSPFTSDFWKLDMDTSKGFALSKFSDAAIISFVLVISFILSGYKLKSIYLTKGHLTKGLIIGIVFFVLFGYLALNNPQERPDPGFLKNNYSWILVFVLANGFMEELIFRGIFLERLNKYFKPVWSIILTSICFAAPHLTVNYQSNAILFAGIVFILGMLCGYAMQYTKSIIAPMLIHAGADLMIIIPVFVSYGVTY
jgi:membrane protease YdiL (CAAX protease family)